MPTYRYTGESPVSVPDLKRMADDPVKPREKITTDLIINNAFFELIEAGAPAKKKEASK